MAVVTIQTYSATEVNLTIDGQSFIYKKSYCFTSTSGDYLYFYAHQAELNALRQQYTILYTDVTDPSATSALDLKAKVDAIIAAYGVMDNAYLAYYDTTTQTNALLVNYLAYNTKDFERAITIRNGDEITFDRDGIHNIQFSAQVEKTDSGIDDIEIWLERNGNKVTNSSTILTLPGNNAKAVAAWNWLVNVTAGDYYKIAWYSDDAQMQITARGSQTSPDRPEVPSVILTVLQVTGGNT